MCMSQGPPCGCTSRATTKPTWGWWLWTRLSMSSTRTNSLRVRWELQFYPPVSLSIPQGQEDLSRSSLCWPQVWDTVENSDIGCTPGSGRNHVGVFADAGLSLTSNVNINTEQRSGE